MEYICDVEAEPAYRYVPGGYHPIQLGDTFSQGRYKILHKIGWGGYSTVWAAKDMQELRYVALKVTTSDARSRKQEQHVMRTISSYAQNHPWSQYIMKMHDHFQITGPNGSHDCLVLELLGPSITDILENRIERLPGYLAKSIAKQVVKGVSYLHSNNIGHGDLHVRNIAFSLDLPKSLTESDFLEQLGSPRTAPVKRKNGQPIGDNAPDYLVWPATFEAFQQITSNSIKICDFGESFVASSPPEKLNTPTSVRPPEVIFGDKLDYRVDLWSLGCLIFELVTARPPFDTVAHYQQQIVVQEMLDMTLEKLPSRWEDSWKAMSKKYLDDEPSPDLQKWLEEVYFDCETSPELSRDDILKIGQLVKNLLRLEPSNRTEAANVLKDSWFDAIS